MTIAEATDQQAWDSFLAQQQFRPFLQSWTMGEVYRDCGQEPIRLEVRENGSIVAICQAILVEARRGRHLSIPYGPVFNYQLSHLRPAFASATAGRQGFGGQATINYQLVIELLITELSKVAKEHQCSFIRMSPFWQLQATSYKLQATTSPLHLLAEHLWYLPLTEQDLWSSELQATSAELQARSEDSLLMSMRKTTRNLIRRAERDGVTIEASTDPNRDIEHFLALHEETRRRHGFTPYTHAFFRSQVRRFANRGEATLYLARFQGEVAAASIHIHAFGETSYHHGASTHRLSKVPASYLLQWTAIRDALQRGDHVYNFWGIAPPQDDNQEQLQATSYKLQAHPFAGVTLFKTGFGGQLLNLTHCMDFPLSWKYHVTRSFEQIRKWKRGF